MSYKHQHQKQNHNLIIDTLHDYTLENELFHEAIETLAGMRHSNMVNKKNQKNQKTSVAKMENFVIHVNENNQLSNEKNQKTEIKKDKWFFPKQNDALFWIFYIVQHGLGQYEYIKNDAFKVEKDWKINEIEHIRKEKGLLKANKIKKAEIENQLLNEKAIDLKTLQALCLLYKKNIVYIWGRKYIEFLHDPNEMVYVCELKNNKTRMYHDEYASTILKECRDKYWKIENIKKPLKSYSTYLLHELHDICTKLNIEMFHSSGKKKTKKDLYQKILETL